MRTLVLFLSVFSFELVAGETPINSITVEVGKQITVKGRKDYDAHLSRKGIIDVVPLGSGRWNLVGLKPGFVILDVGKRFYVETLSKTAAKKMKKGSASKNCGNTFVYCEGKVAWVSSLDLFFLTQKDCHSFGLCAHLMKLTDSAQIDWRQRLRSAVGGEADLHVFEGGKALVQIWCRGEGHVEAVSKSLSPLVGGEHVDVMCKNDLRFEMKQIAYRIYVVEDGSDRRWGSSGEVNLVLSADTPEFGFLSELNTKVSKKEGSLLATPMMKVLLGKKMSMSSGGELLIRSMTGDSQGNRHEWKKHGVRIDSSLIKTRDMRYLLNYDLSLSQPTGGLESLIKNTLKGDSILEINKPMLLGSARVKRDDKREASFSILSQIPIIGIFFRSQDNFAQESLAYIWVAVGDLGMDMNRVFMNR